MALAGNCHAAFLHGLEQRRLGFRRCAVDFIREQQVGKDRALLEPEVARGTGRILFQHLRASDVRGHEVRSKLDSLALKLERVGQRPRHQRFGQPGRPHKQAVTPAKKRHEDLVNDVGLPDERMRCMA